MAAGGCEADDLGRPVPDPEITAEYPRLELLRCILLCLAWRFDEAAALFEAVGRRTDRYVATIAIGAELILEQHDGEAVIRFLRKSAEDVQATNIESMSNNVAALLAHYLAEAGRPDEAGEVWRDYGLPCAATELVDLDRQSWRTMEALSCARIRAIRTSTRNCDWRPSRCSPTWTNRPPLPRPSSRHGSWRF